MTQKKGAILTHRSLFTARITQVDYLHLLPANLTGFDTIHLNIDRELTKASALPSRLEEKKIISSRLDFISDIEIPPYSQTFLQESSIGYRKVFRRPSTFIVTEAERILRLSFTTRETAGCREKRKRSAASHGRLHLPSRRMTPRAQKGLVVRGYDEVMQNKCAGEYLLRSSFDGLNRVTGNSSTRSRDDPDGLYSHLTLPLCTLKLQNTTHPRWFTARIPGKALQNCKDSKNPALTTSFMSHLSNEAGLHRVYLSWICRLRGRERFEISRLSRWQLFKI